MHFYYDGQGRPAIVNYNGSYYHYLYNLQGDVIGLVDTSGSLVVEYKYNAWGSILGRTGSLVNTLGALNPFRYRGYVYDDETAMCYCRSRYYYPELHRFISADVLLGKTGALLSHNLFCYCWNNPIGRYDPNGQSSLSDLIDRGNFDCITVVSKSDPIGGVFLTYTDNITFIPYDEAVAIGSIELGSEILKKGIEEALKEAMGIERAVFINYLKQYMQERAITRRDHRIANYFPSWVSTVLFMLDAYNSLVDFEESVDYGTALFDAAKNKTGVVRITSTITSNHPRVVPVTTVKYREWTDYLNMLE